MALKDKTGKVLSRSEGEAVMKSRGAITISIYALVLAICTLLANSNSGRVLQNTLKANDTWAFFQAKSIKQTVYVMASEELTDQLITTKDAETRSKIQARLEFYKKTINRYETEPETGEGKKELMQKAIAYEKDRDAAKANGPYYSFAASALQIAIVLSSTAILAVSMGLLWASVASGIIGTALLLHAVFGIFSFLF